MFAALVLAAAATPLPVVEAERAFAAMAQTEGQWTAFRAYAAPDAVMFVPDAVNAQEWLAGKPDPLQPVMWWPARAIVSCDGTTAVTTGPWIRDGGRSRGYFTTIWRRQEDGGWKWVLDHGDVLDVARPAVDTVGIRKPNCTNIEVLKGRPSPSYARQGESIRGDRGRAPDVSLLWTWETRKDGSRELNVSLWNGREHEPVLVDEVAASQ